LALNSARRYCRSNLHFVFLSRFIAVSSTEVERLLDHHSHEAIANILNPRDLVSGYGKPFAGRMIGCMWFEYGLESHFERLRAKGMLTLDEMAQRLDISTQQLKTWRAVGLVRAHLCNHKNEYLDEDPGADPSIYRSIDPSIHHGKPVA
jgi:hypothetical protein